MIYGSVVLSVEDILRNLGKEHALMSEKNRVGGHLFFQDWVVVDKPSFVEYLKSGWYINLAVSIDLSKSNTNLHALSESQEELNDYQRAILEVGRILEPYAYKQKFAGFGFGGIPRYNGATRVSHCFTLNGQGDPTLTGLSSL